MLIFGDTPTFIIEPQKNATVHPYGCAVAFLFERSDACAQIQRNGVTGKGKAAVEGGDGSDDGHAVAEFTIGADKGAVRVGDVRGRIAAECIGEGTATDQRHRGGGEGDGSSSAIRKGQGNSQGLAVLSDIHGGHRAGDGDLRGRVGGAPNAALDERQGVVGGLPLMAGGVEVALLVAVVELVEVADNEAIAAKEEVGAVVGRAVPDGFADLGGVRAVVCPVLQGDHGGGGGRRGGGLHGGAGVTQLFDGHSARAGESIQLFGLHLVAGADVRPAEAVLLAGGGVGLGEAGGLVVGAEEDIHDAGIGAGAPNRLQSGTAREDGGVLVLVITVGGIDAQHAVKGGLDGVLGGLCGGKHVAAGGVVTAVVVAAPEGVGIDRPLLTADAEGLHLVLVAHVGEGVAVKEPGTGDGGVVAEDLLKKAEGLINQRLALGGGVGGEKAGVHEPVPVITGATAPFNTHLFGQGATHLEPQADLHVLVGLTAEQLHDIGADEGVVLDENSMVKAVLLIDSDLLGDGGIEIDIRVARLTTADEVDEVHDAFSHGNSPFVVNDFKRESGLGGQMAVKLGHNEAEGVGVASTGEDDIGIFLGWLDIPLVHGLDRCEVLLHDIGQGAAALAHIAVSAAQNALVGIGIDVNLEVDEGTKVIEVVEQDAVDDEDVGGIKVDGNGVAGMGFEVVDRVVDALPGAKSADMGDHERHIQCLGRVEVELLAFLEGQRLMREIVAVATQCRDMSAVQGLKIIRKRGFSRAAAAGDTDDVHMGVLLYLYLIYYT